MTAGPREPAAPRRWLLFVVGGEPNSLRARENAERLLSAAGDGCELRVVDVLEDFQDALAHNVLVTPTLVQTHPPPRTVILGSLTDTGRVRAVLGLEAEP
jgi:hypothetical protein